MPVPIINLDLTDDEQLDYKTSDGDIIRIAKVTDRLSKSIVLRGAVKRPGRYGWFKGIRFSNILSTINADFLDSFDTNKGLIVRRINTNNYEFLLSISDEKKYSIAITIFQKL